MQVISPAIAGIDGFKLIGIAKMLVHNKKCEAFKELRRMTGMKGSEVAFGIGDIWRAATAAISNSDADVIGEVLPDNTCVSCMGGCGDRKDKISSIWDDQEMHFKGVDCEKIIKISDFTVKCKSITLIKDRLKDGTKSRNTKDRSWCSVMQVRTDANGITKVTRYRKNTDGEELGRRERAAIIPEHSLKRRMRNLLMNGVKMDILDCLDDFTIRNIRLASGEKYSSYINRVHDEIRRGRREKAREVDEMTDEQLMVLLGEKIASSKIGGVLAALGGDINEFIETYFPNKSVREIYKEISR